jgi:hypothetical protein
MSNVTDDKFEYRIAWVEQDKEWVGTCTKFPSLSHCTNGGAFDALAGIRDLVMDVEKYIAREQSKPPEGTASATAVAPDENLSAVLQGRMSLADFRKSREFAEMAKEATMREVVGSAATASWIMDGTSGGVGDPRSADGTFGSGGGGGGSGGGIYFVPLPDEVLTTTGK